MSRTAGSYDGSNALAIGDLVDERNATAALGGRGPAVVAPSQISSDAFVLGYVSSRGARELIRSALLSAGGVEGRDFLMCA